MPGEFQVGKRFRVGIVVLIALFAVMIGIFMVGQRAHLFVKKFPYETRFDSASGLVAGNPVRLNGVTVGNVLEVILSPNPKDRTVRVVYDVDRRAAPRLRKGKIVSGKLEGGTRAAIKTIGLLGDKYIELEGGTDKELEVEIGGTIPQAEKTGGIEKLLEGSLSANLEGIAQSLNNILARTEQGKGFLGALTTDSEESVRLGNNLTATLTSLNSILRKVDAGQGLVGKLLIDQKYGQETSDSLQAAIRSVQSLLGKIDQGLQNKDGLLAALLSDPEGKKKVYTLLDNLTTAAGSLGNTIGQLEKGNGTLAILLRDEAFAREFTGNLRSFSRSLDSIGRKLDSGQGTAGRLINDPAIFDAANHLVIGIDESRLLRWLIRNRQRAGIKKVYDQESGKASPHASDISPAPPPPPEPTRHPSS